MLFVCEIAYVVSEDVETCTGFVKVRVIAQLSETAEEERKGSLLYQEKEGSLEAVGRF